MSMTLSGVDKPYKIFAEYLEYEAIQQFESAMRQPFVVRGALMPDAHAGYSLPIGAVVATTDVIVPAWVGYDIGCGMCAVRTTFDRHDIEVHAKQIFDELYERIPVGFNHNKTNSESADLERLPMTPVLKAIFERNGLKQLGSLGSGNHFLEIGHDAEDAVWIVIHSGSRGIGHAVATHYMKLASGDGKAREGHYGLSADSQEGKDYITDLNFCLAFALENRRIMIQRAIAAMKKFAKGDESFPFINRNHNHAERKLEVTEGDEPTLTGRELWIHRKGATHADEGMLGVIPGNMRDGSFIVRGKGNPESLFSSSHGAGRVLGRAKAKDTLNLDDFKAMMQGVTARVETATLDESPLAYKDIYEVMRLQDDLVDVVAHVRPILNVKG